MKTKLTIVVAIGLIITSLFSCVPARKLEEVKAKKEQCEAERKTLKGENEELTTTNNELQDEIESMKMRMNALLRDTAIKGDAYRTLTQQYDKINELYDQLLANTEKLRAGADAETQKALAMLQDTRDLLQKKEDELNALEAKLNEEKANLEILKTQLELKEKELEGKEARVRELESILQQKDSIMNALHNKVVNALLGFEGDGLTVTQKNGKVYVSLDEKLLFKSGKWDVDPKGQEALTKLAQVLEKNKDIDITIEGHTDDLAYRANGFIEDNWDLSVKRATAIVKILLANSDINPARLTAAGRGQFIPVDTGETSEARAKNRRTEIILTPKLDELYNLFNQ
jgi:chemotaxis protein MotB